MAVVFETLGQIERLLFRAYTHFVYRDLAYLSGGLVVLAIPAYVSGGLRYLEGAPWWVVITSLVFVFGVGFVTLEAGVAAGLVRMYPRGPDFVEQEVEAIDRIRVMATNCGEAANLQFERIVVLKHVSAVLGSAVSVAFLELQVLFFVYDFVGSWGDYILWSVILLAALWATLRRNWTAAEVQARLLNRWTGTSPPADPEDLPELKGALDVQP